MNKKRGLILVSLLAVVFMINFASAEIFYNEQPKETYSLGDKLSFSLGTDGSEGWVNTDLICSNSSRMVYFHYLGAGESNVNVDVPLTKSFLRDMFGECHLTSSFNGQIKDSLNFYIDNSITFDVTFNKNEFNPNETIFFTGDAQKTNGGEIIGFADIKFSSISAQVIIPLAENKFSGNLSIPSNQAAGDYSLEAFVYEKDVNDEITNFGRKNYTIKIIQKPSILEIISQDQVMPGEDIEFSAKLYDQAGMTIEGVPVAFTLYDINGEQIINVLSTTGKANYYKLNKNAEFGYWNLSAESEGLSANIKPVYIKENKEASFELLNNTALVRNIGNVPYDKFVEIFIGNYSEIKFINLSVGKSIEFELNAPNGEYEISISDGENDFNGVAALTGNAIAINDAGRGALGFFNKYFFAWFLIIGILGLFIFVSGRKVFNRKSVFSMSSMKPHNSPNEYNISKPTIGLNPLKKGGVVNATPRKQYTPPPEPMKLSQMPVKMDSFENNQTKQFASPSLVIHGEKQKASIISVRIRSNEQLGRKSVANETVERIIDIISQNKGRAYKSDGMIVGIFAPSITRTFDNSLDALNVGYQITGVLKDYNNKYIPKLSFGVGLHEGEIIAKKDKGNLLFTPLNNALITSKKVSEVANEEILISDEANKVLVGKIKSSLHSEIKSTRVYTVNEVSDKTKNYQFINKFLDRNKEYKSLSDFRAKF